MPQPPTNSPRRRIRPLTKGLTRPAEGPEPQARGAPEARHSTVEYRGASPELRISWRDATLDQVVKTLAKNQDTKDLSRRLWRLIETARGYEAHSERDWTGGARKGLADWISERLPELGRKRIDSSYRSARLASDYLVGLFRDARAELAQRGMETKPAAWRPIVRNAWADEQTGAGQKGAWVRRQQDTLTDAQVDAIAVTQRGRIRSPKSMALEMVAKLLGRHDPQELGRELSRVRLGPLAL
jgi:hypothetical protein